MQLTTREFDILYLIGNCLYKSLYHRQIPHTIVFLLSAGRLDYSPLITATPGASCQTRKKIGPEAQSSWPTSVSAKVVKW